jgi:hypothetical protein
MDSVVRYCNNPLLQQPAAGVRRLLGRQLTPRCTGSTPKWADPSCHELVKYSLHCCLRMAFTVVLRCFALTADV